MKSNGYNKLLGGSRYIHLTNEEYCSSVVTDGDKITACTPHYNKLWRKFPSLRREEVCRLSIEKSVCDNK